MRLLRLLLFVVQATLALRVLRRMAGSAGGARIEPADPTPGDAGSVSVVVPVLNEIGRLGPCLRSLMAQGPEVAEILVVDGGSVDGTPELVRRFAEQEVRIRLLDASPTPPSLNGKAHNLRAGYGALAPGTRWVLTIDADVRCRPGLVAALLARARASEVAALSAATSQRVAGPGDGLLHPAMLATLVYRFGIPGRATTNPRLIQANGQCMLLRRDALRRVGGFDGMLTSVCEDVTLARSLAADGIPVGFYEAGPLAEVAMYGNWRETWTNWARSLPMRDRFSGVSTFTGLAEVTLVQSAPLWIAPLARRSLGPRHPLALLNAALVATRFGVLAGMRRAYVERPWTYWLSPVCDGPVAVRLWLMALRRRHTWRGRVLERGGDA